MEINLLTLHLQAPIEYSSAASMENFFESEPSAEGHDEDLCVYEAASLIALNPDHGPKIVRPLPRPLFFGLHTIEENSASRGGYTLVMGDYSFLQVRLKGQNVSEKEAALAQAVEHFVREAWWQRRKQEDRIMIRRVYEDGAVAYQILQKLAV